MELGLWWGQGLGELQDRSGRSQAGAGIPGSLYPMSLPQPPHPRRLVFLESIFCSRVVAQGHRGPAQLARCDSGLCGAKGPKITPGHPPQFLLHTEEMWCLRLVRGKDTLHAETEEARKWRQQRQTGVLRQRCFPSPTELSPERAGRKPLWQVPQTSAH